MSRPAGSKNKVGAQVKENIVAVFNRLGGTAGMAKWAENNQTEFYRFYARLAPTEVVAEVFHDVADLSDAELASIATGRGEGVTEPPPSPVEPSSVH